MIGGNMRVNQDALPYCLHSDFNITPKGLNLIGLRRPGLARDTIASLKSAYQILFHSHLKLKQALERIEQEIPNEYTLHLVDFVRDSKRGIPGPAAATGAPSGVIHAGSLYRTGLERACLRSIADPGAGCQAGRRTYPSIKVSREQASAAAAGIALARTSYLPKVDFTSQVNRATRNNIYGMLLPQSVIAPISGPPVRELPVRASSAAPSDCTSPGSPSISAYASPLSMPPNRRAARPKPPPNVRGSMSPPRPPPRF